MSRSRFRFWMAMVLVAICSISVGWAQLYTGSMTGVVVDPSGGVIPNANVTLTDVSRGFTYKAVTDTAGRYVVRSLPPSTYNVKVEASGFRSAVQENVNIAVNQNATVDIPLSVQGTEQSIQVVETGTPALQTEDAVTGQNINRTFINDLPLVGRAVFDLAKLAPGISEPRNSGGWDTNFISQGSRNATADVLLDGVSTVSAEQNGTFQLPLYTPSVDAVQEFKVQQSSFSAEVGFTGSTVMNVVTRSGTNAFHGSVYEFFRNEKLNANNFFANAAGRDAQGNAIAPMPKMRWNQFGGTIGGPIKRDRIFFFADYQGTRERAGQTFRGGVPSAAMKAGDFSEICSAGFDSTGLCKDGGGQIWDPYVAHWDNGAGGPIRDQFVPFNNIANYISPGAPQAGMPLPQTKGNLIDPVAAKMMSYFPAPNFGVGSAAYNRFNNWIGTASNGNTGDQIDSKIDFRISDANMLSGKVAWGRANGTSANCYPNPMDPCSSGPSIGGPRLAAVNYNHTFSPTMLLSLSLGLTRNFQDRPGVTGDFPDYNYIGELGLPSYMTQSGLNAAPTIYLNNYASPACCGNFGGQGWGIMKYAREAHHLIGNVSRVQGRHELKFGGELRLHRINFRQAGYPGSLEVFQNNSTSKEPWSGGGDPMAGFLIGYPGYGTWGGVELPLYVSTVAWKYAGFVQDNWRVTDKMTLNLGIRYDVEMPRTERYNRMSYLDANAPAVINPPGISLKGAPFFTTPEQRTQYDTDKNNFAPRFGFAYQFSPKTVARGGYGIFYVPSKVGAAGTGPGGNLGFQPSTPWQSTDPRIAQSPYPFALLRNPAPLGVTPYPTAAQLNSNFNLGLDLQSPIRSWGTSAYEQTWSLGVQREIAWGTVLEATYIGKRGVHLPWGGADGLNYLPESVGQDYIRGNGAYWTEQVTNPMYGYITDPGGGLANETVGRSQLLRPFPQYTGFGAGGGGSPPWANSFYHALQLRFEKRLSNGLQFLTTYVFSKSIDDSSTSGGNTDWLGSMNGGSPQDPNKRFLERSISLFDQTHQFQFSWVYSLPFGKGRTFGSSAPGMLDALFGGWQVNGIYRWTSGFPVQLGLANGQSVPTWGGQRANLSAPLTKNDNWKSTINTPNNQYFANPDVVSKPAQYAIGTSPRALSNIRWPGTNNMSASLFKQFRLDRLHEGMSIEVRLETFNTLNHVQFGGPDSNFGGGSFGQINYQNNGARQVQLGGKFYF